jgi:ABC-type sugar transport system ATPase subunit
MEINHADRAIPPGSTIPVTVDVIELLGNEIFVYLTAANQTLTARMAPDVHLTRGQEIEVAAPPDKLYFFDPKTEEVIK